MQMKRLLREEGGVVLIEAAIIMFTFVIIIIALIDFGAILIDSIQINNALRIGEQYIIKNPASSANVVSVINRSTSIPVSQMTASTTTFCECDRVATSCSSTCTGTMATFLNISVSNSVSLFVNYPYLTNPYVLNKSVAVRIQ